MSMMDGGEGKDGMPAMMSKMVESNDSGESLTMPERMTQMTPHCLKIRLTKLAKEQRINDAQVRNEFRPDHHDSGACNSRHG